MHSLASPGRRARLQVRTLLLLKGVVMVDTTCGPTCTGRFDCTCKLVSQPVARKTKIVLLLEFLTA